MARTALTVNSIVRAGLADPAATTGTADGHKAVNGGDLMLEFNNANASARIVTIQTPPTVGEFEVEDLEITIPGSASRFKVSELEMGYFNQPAGHADAGSLYIDYPAGQHTDLTVRAYEN